MGFVGTYDSRVRVIEGRVLAGCCCEPCDCEIDGPLADFDYEQTSNSPCTINLINQSVAGECGDIVSYRWLKNGVEFSTSSNPSGVTVSGGDDITLEVTDENGCTDSAVMEVTCVALCVCCSTALRSCTVVASGFANNTCAGPGSCGDVNGTHTLTPLAPTNLCNFDKRLPTGTGCGVIGPYIQVLTCSSGKLYAFFFTDGFSGSTVTYSMTWPLSVNDCRGTHVLTLESVLSTNCSVPPTVTVILG